jgi:Alpha/beta hydrolase family
MDQLGIGDFHVAGYCLGARVSLELATRGRIRSVVAIAPDGLGTPPERVYQATALMAGRTMATLLAPVATLMAASGPGRSLFFAMERSRPWKLTRQDARQLLLNFASAPAYEQTVLAGMVDIPAGLDRITCPVLIMQGTADPLISMQSPRFRRLSPARSSGGSTASVTSPSPTTQTSSPGSCSMSFLRYLVRCRSAATCASGMKLARSSPYSCSSAIHWQSVISRLRPGTLRMCAALHTHTSIPAWASAW